MEPGESQLDPHQLAAWYSDHADRLKAFLFGVLREQHSVEEAFQATMTKALTHGGTVQKGSEKAWLFQVAYNEAMGIRRRDGITKRVLEKESRGRPDQVVFEDQLVRWETVNQVRKALDELPEEQRTIVEQRVYGEKTFQEIATQQNIPLGTVLTRMKLALQKLHKKLK